MMCWKKKEPAQLTLRLFSPSSILCRFLFSGKRKFIIECKFTVLVAHNLTDHMFLSCVTATGFKELPRRISSFPSSIRSEVISLSPMNCWKPRRFRQRVPKLKNRVYYNSFTYHNQHLQFLFIPIKRYFIGAVNSIEQRS